MLASHFPKKIVNFLAANMAPPWEFPGYATATHGINAVFSQRNKKRETQLAEIPEQLYLQVSRSEKNACC
jgi:hypothetical protein